jgi:hypothetical protein
MNNFKEIENTILQLFNNWNIYPDELPFKIEEIENKIVIRIPRKYGNWRTGSEIYDRIADAFRDDYIPLICNEYIVLSKGRNYDYDIQDFVNNKLS